MTSLRNIFSVSNVCLLIQVLYICSLIANVALVKSPKLKKSKKNMVARIAPSDKFRTTASVVREKTRPPRMMKIAEDKNFVTTSSLPVEDTPVTSSVAPKHVTKGMVGAIAVDPPETTPGIDEEIIAITHREEALIATTPGRVEEMIAMTRPRAEEIIAMTPPTEEMIAMTRPRVEEIIAMTPPTEEMIAITRPRAEEIIAMTPPTEELIAITRPRAEEIIAMTPPTEEMIAITRPRVEEIIAMTPPTEEMIAMTRPRVEAMIAMTPPAEEMIAMTRPRVEAMIAMTPPAEEMIAMTRPRVEAMIAMTPPAEEMIAMTRPRVEAMIAMTPPAEEMIAMTRPRVEAMIAMTPPAEEMIAMTRPRVEAMIAMTPPAEEMIAMTRPRETAEIIAMTPPTEEMIAMTRPRVEAMIAMTPPAEEMIAMTRPRETAEIIAMTPPTEEMIAMTRPRVEAMIAMTPPTEEMIAMTRPRETAEIIAMTPPTEEMIAMTRPRVEEIIAMTPPTEEMIAMTRPRETAEIIAMTPPREDVIAHDSTIGTPLQLSALLRSSSNSSAEVSSASTAALSIPTTAPKTGLQHHQLGSLLESVLIDYDRRLRPRYNQARFVAIFSDFVPFSIIDFNTQEQRFSVMGYFKMDWRDDFLTWDPNMYENTKYLRIPVQSIWIPKLSIDKSYDGNGIVGDMNTDIALINYRGYVRWFPEGIYSVVCKVTIRFYPFDIQTCTFSYTIKDEDNSTVNLKYDGVVDLTEYIENAEWKLNSLTATREQVDTMFVVKYQFDVERRGGFAIFTLVVPVLMLSTLSGATFLIPIESGEKCSFSVTIFLAYGIFETVVIDTLPHNSMDVSYFILYLTSLLIVSVLLTFYTILQAKIFDAIGDRQFRVCRGSNPDNMLTWGTFLRKLDTYIFIGFLVLVLGLTSIFIAVMGDKFDFV